MKTIKSEFEETNSMIKKQINMISQNSVMTAKIQVGRKCENCANHILQTALLVIGVIKAEWDIIADILIVEFDTSKTNSKIIELSIADAGHDTPNFKGKNNFYTLMPQCCEFNENKFYYNCL